MHSNNICSTNKNPRYLISMRAPQMVHRPVLVTVWHDLWRAACQGDGLTDGPTPPRAPDLTLLGLILREIIRVTPPPQMPQNLHELKIHIRCLWTSWHVCTVISGAHTDIREVAMEAFWVLVSALHTAYVWNRFLKV